jgi:hypothetical protein
MAFRGHGVLTERTRAVVQIQHFEGAIFEDRQLAEAHGVALCRKWIDKRS